MTNPTAKDAIIMVAGLALRNRRNTRISEATEIPAPNISTTGTSTNQGRLPRKTMAVASIDGHSSAKTQNAM